jgi:hypothetical protein
MPILHPIPIPVAPDKELTESHYILLRISGSPRDPNMSISVAMAEGTATEPGSYPSGEFQWVQNRGLTVNPVLLASLPGGGDLISALSNALTAIFIAQGDYPPTSGYVRDQV